jgi:RNA polymerase sigma-70 factor (ECF subfamily)
MIVKDRSTGIDVERVEEGAGDVANDGKLGRVNPWSQGVERRTEREERLQALILKRSKLDARDAAFLDEVYTQVMRAHHRGVWDYLRRRGLDLTEVEDMVQDTFMAFYEQVLESGFPTQIGGTLRGIVRGKLLNHMRGQRRSPCSVGLPSSGSEPPRTGPDVERAIDLRTLLNLALDRLTAEHRKVVELVILGGLTCVEAAEVLNVNDSTLKSRLVTAKKALLEEVMSILPPSQQRAA